MTDGEADHRAYVGPPGRYDLIAAMVFNLLTCLGLREHHRLIDVGCGSLRVGRLLIPYLNPSNYIGVEPHESLVRAGIEKEVGRDLLRIKAPVFLFDSSLARLDRQVQADFVVAQSIFSHCGVDLIRGWLSDIARHLRPEGIFVATFFAGAQDFPGSGWVYPRGVAYRSSTMQSLAAEFGFQFKTLDWSHPRQTWCIFWRSGTNTSLFADGQVSWNRLVSWQRLTGTLPQEGNIALSPTTGTVVPNAVEGRPQFTGYPIEEKPGGGPRQR